MSKACQELHLFFNSFDRKRFPFDKSEIPLNGIYILYEKGEYGHGTDRIVRVGTHTGVNQLPSRLEQHFLKENKDRSIFRKNIGRAILNKSQDGYLKVWNLDFTTKKAKEENHQLVDLKKQERIEKIISEYIQKNFSFVIFQENVKKDRLDMESKIISTISLCDECGPSKRWLGSNSPLEKIRKSGLWLVQHLYKEQFSESESKLFIKRYGR